MDSSLAYRSETRQEFQRASIGTYRNAVGEFFADFLVAPERIEWENLMGSTVEQRGAATVTEEDLKFMVALLNYSLFSCPVDGGIDLADGTTASRSMIEDLGKRLQNSGQISDNDLQFMNAILDYSLFACSVDSGIDIGDGVTANREMIEALKKRVEETLDSRAQHPREPAMSVSKGTDVETTRQIIEPELDETALKALIAILDYSVFTCPEEGIDISDGSTADMETIGNLKKRLEQILAARQQT